MCQQHWGLSETDTESEDVLAEDLTAGVADEAEQYLRGLYRGPQA